MLLVKRLKYFANKMLKHGSLNKYYKGNKLLSLMHVLIIKLILKMLFHYFYEGKSIYFI